MKIIEDVEKKNNDEGKNSFYIDRYKKKKKK